MADQDTAPADTVPTDTVPTDTAPTIEEEASTDTVSLEPRLPLNELRVFAEAFNRISSAYVEEIDDKTLLENAIKGMLSQMDPHSSYLDKDSFDDLQESTSGNYGGLGIEIGMEDGFVKVISPMDDTPAAKAGIESGDLIIQLNDTPVKGMSLSDAIEAMRGEPGSEIEITLIKTDNPTPTPLTLTREVIKVASVRHRYLEEGFGYLRIAQFQSGTGGEVEKAVIQLKDEGDLEGLIIDLRNNPGGVLQSAVAVSDVFIDGGLIVSTRGRMEDSEHRYNARTPDSIHGVPIVVLVNAGTASASEIVAGALQDHSRAIVMGTTTFGKGSVQTILPLTNEKAIKLTTARYYTPNGKSIQAAGIIPDIWVGRSKVTPAKSNPWRIKEKNLAKHLAADNESAKGESDVDDPQSPASPDPDSPDSPESASPYSSNMELAVRDYQLNEALTLLKGLHILGRTKTPQG
ncbi:MAG: S41 family peptidase [Gammaproteobacteria bacterium]|nr:S41 family peptidase [Gammaproteobacteria bacterium]MBT3870915.1 S41 family peptidase [Gammaproteobacteria bacterium]MBT4381638.1 S41 family peptidase [Gammaproteobacteria bacterium]MBT4619161.1 S41 family peptidase [Gammaproteobacteria bacterium]MBT5441405.1 S41 family peptidase [Gammaproteobacteria bacterium]